MNRMVICSLSAPTPLLVTCLCKKKKTIDSGKWKMVFVCLFDCFDLSCEIILEFTKWMFWSVIRPGFFSWCFFYFFFLLDSTDSWYSCDLLWHPVKLHIWWRANQICYRGKRTTHHKEEDNILSFNYQALLMMQDDPKSKELLVPFLEGIDKEREKREETDQYFTEHWTIDGVWLPITHLIDTEVLIGAAVIFWERSFLLFIYFYFFYFISFWHWNDRSAYIFGVKEECTQGKFS